MAGNHYVQALDLSPGFGDFGIANMGSGVIQLIFRRCFCKKIYFCKWWIVANDCDFESFKIIALLKCIFLHKHVKHSLLKLSRLCHYSIKIIFFGYIKTPSVEIIQKYMVTCGM